MSFRTSDLQRAAHLADQKLCSILDLVVSVQQIDMLLDDSIGILTTGRQLGFAIAFVAHLSSASRPAIVS